MENSTEATSEKIIEGWVVMAADEVRNQSLCPTKNNGRVVVYQRLIDVLQKYETKRPEIVFLRVRVEGKITEGGHAWCVASKLKVIDQYDGAELQRALFAASVEIGDEMLDTISGQLEEVPLTAAQAVLGVLSGLLELPTMLSDPGYDELRTTDKRLWETIQHIDPEHHRAIRAAVAMPYNGIAWGTQGCVTTIVQLLSRDMPVEQATTEAKKSLHSFNQILERRVMAIDSGLSRTSDPWYLVDEPVAAADHEPLLDLGESDPPPRRLSEIDRKILHDYRQLCRISDTEIIYTFRESGIEFPDHGQLLPWESIEEIRPRYEMKNSFFLTERDVKDIWKQVQSALARFEDRRGYAENQKPSAGSSSNAERVATVAESLEIIRAAAAEPLTDQEAGVWFLCKRAILSLRDLDPQLRMERLELLQQIVLLVGNQ